MPNVSELMSQAYEKGYAGQGLLPSPIENRFTEVSEQLAENTQQLVDMQINVMFPPSGFTPAKGTGVATDNDAPAIQAIIDYLSANGGGVVYLPGRSFYIATTLIWKSNVTIKGVSQKTKLILASSMVGIKGVNGLNGGKLIDFDIIGTNPYTATSIGVQFDDDYGGWLNYVENVRVFYCEKGFSARDIWFSNKFSRTFASHCRYSYYFVYKAVGSTINNTFENIYADKPDGYAIQLSSCRRMIFINPNIDLTTYPTAIYTLLNVEANFLGGNMEGADLPNGGAIVYLGASTTITFDGVKMKPASIISGTGFGVNVDGTDSNVILINCNIEKIANFTQIRTAQKTGTSIINLSPKIDSFLNATGSGANAQFQNLMGSHNAISSEIVLSGSSVELPILYNSRPTRILTAKVIYSQATSADAGITLTLKAGALVMGTATTDVSAAVGATTDFALTYRSIGAGIPLRISAAGGKVGNGKCVVSIEYYVE